MNHTLDGFADIDESNPQISELMKKVSKDKANFHGWGISQINKRRSNYESRSCGIRTHRKATL